MLKRARLLTLLLMMTFIVGCSSVKVSQDFDPAKPLEAFKTYSWQAKIQPPTGDIRADNPLLDARIRAAVERNLATLGYIKTTEGTPDFYVAYRYVIQRKSENDQPRVGFGFGLGSGGSFGGIGIGTGSSVSQYDQSLLVIDLLDARDNGLIWRGNGSRRIDQHTEPEKTTEQINEMVDKILSQITSTS